MEIQGPVSVLVLVNVHSQRTFSPETVISNKGLEYSIRVCRRFKRIVLHLGCCYQLLSVIKEKLLLHLYRWRRSHIVDLCSVWLEPLFFNFLVFKKQKSGIFPYPGYLSAYFNSILQSCQGIKDLGRSGELFDQQSETRRRTKTSEEESECTQFRRRSLIENAASACWADCWAICWRCPRLGSKQQFYCCCSAC